MYLVKNTLNTVWRHMGQTSILAGSDFLKVVYMDSKEKHLAFIREKEPFKVRCKTAIFSSDQIEILEKYGNWFQALTDGVIEPITDMQEEFLKVARKEKMPVSPYEWAWFKYLGRLEWESQNNHIMEAEYRLEEDSFYNRDMAKLQRGMMFKVTRDNHRK